ncbi:MAG: (2Fe-2S)-binding protein [Methylotenera sp.]|jgi:bacterioferritin-associated ferredoxin|nr:(2Fe-2S)-binding protein [Methylotenera sp.]
MATENDNLANEVMCACSGTTRGKIQSLYKQGLDIDSISSWTGTLSGCGGCEWDIAQFLKELNENEKE